MRTHRWLLAFVIAAAPIVSGAQPLVKRASATQAPPNPSAAAPSPKPPVPSPPPAPLEKTVLGMGVPTARTEFSVSPDGKRSYFAEGSAYYVFDENGDAVERMPTKGMARTLALLPDGHFISALSHAGGHVALLGPDGTELKSLVGRGASTQKLRTDTSWSTPSGLALDSVHHLLFVLDATVAPKGTPDPDWSRVAVFDTTGKYLRSIAPYDGSKAPSAEEYRTRYDDIEVDAKRSVVYITARAARELWAFNYDGTLTGKVPGVAGIAVLPNGNVAVGDPDRRHVRVYDPALKLLKTLDAAGVLDLEADAKGRLYASVTDPTILYLRWPASFSEPEPVHPRFQRMTATIPFDTVKVGVPFSLPVSVTGRPVPRGDEWHVFARPSDGSDLSWRELPSSYGSGAVTVETPTDLRGLYDIAVRYGKGVIARSDGPRDLHVEKTVNFGVGPESGSISVRSVVNRSGFRRGEAIPIRLDVRGNAPGRVAKVTLQRAGSPLARIDVPLSSRYWELPPEVTRRLLPGRYSLEAAVGTLPSNRYDFEIAEAEPDSPLQRILYHEFDQNPASWSQPGTASVPDGLAFVQDYVSAVANLGFTRETDRSAGKLMTPKPAGAWRSDTLAEPADHDTLPLGGTWQPDFYLDRATAAGVHYDTQLLAHCSGVRLGASWFPPLNGTLQRLSQWFGKYPAFYGFNYNDEAFFPNGSNVDGTPEDQAWLSSMAAQLVGHPKPDVLRAGMAHMYAEFDRAVNEIRPDLSRTATPMWQFPAVEGSYAPTIYDHMTESYSHYLSEGYGWPWYPAHSAEMLRRPGRPVMAVIDNGYATEDGESYLKDALLALGRGVQGIGLEHHRPLKEAHGANALRVMNTLAQMYGSVFAEAEPDNEAAVLYSYTQDVTEKRDSLGTPHWERVLALYGAGLMAGLPMSIEYEEDIAAGGLLDGGKPKVKFLFLVGQTTDLPGTVQAALRAFTNAGGTVVIDADSRALPGASRFPIGLLGPAQVSRTVHDSDAVFPNVQPAYEAIAAALSKQFGPERRLAIDSDDPWIAKNRFKGGDIHYLLVAAETSPYPWDGPSTWSLGARFNKSYWPKRVTLSIPKTPVIYDAFEQRILAAAETGTRNIVEADLTTFPGKLYALAPHALASPRLSARVDEDSLTYSVNVGMRARVPLRIELSDGHGASTTFYRGSNLRGEYEQTVGRPLGPGPWRLEVSELLGGSSSSLEIPGAELKHALLRVLPNVEVDREPQIRSLLQQRPNQLVIEGEPELLPPELRRALFEALQKKGVRVTLGSASAPSPATYLLLASMTDKGLLEPALTANQSGLFGRKLGPIYPGPTRGFVSAAFAARSYRENCIALVGGDRSGLIAATQAFIALLGDPARAARIGKETRKSAASITLTGAPNPRRDIRALSERVGVRLSGIQASAGKLALSANGYLGNLARVDDEGDHGRIVAVRRLGEAPVTTSLFLSNDGKSYGIAARTLERSGQTFSLSSATSPLPDDFASFGDPAPYQFDFSVSGDGSTVLAPGPYGVAAWHRDTNGWHEAWAVDDWKAFDSLNWPLGPNASRVPWCTTLIPRGGNLALITFSDTSNGPPKTEITAHSLRDGGARWQFELPARTAIEAPKVYSNSDGSLVVLQTRLANSGPQFHALKDGKLEGQWTTADAPLSYDIADATRRSVSAYGNGSRLVEVRAEDGTVLLSKTWHAQPTAVAFAEDGTSVYLSDDAGDLSRLDQQGNLVWAVQLGCTAELALDHGNLYAAGWDGRLRAFTTDGRKRWQLDLTAAMKKEAIRGRLGRSTSTLHEPKRSPAVSNDVPSGPNLLRTGAATLAVGGTPGWMSTGKVEVEPSTLINGNIEDNDAPWLTDNELFWDATGFRKVWVEVDLKRPTDVHSLTVYENPKFPASWPTETEVEVWDDRNGRWRTVKHAVFLGASRTTYALNLKRVQKLRYVPWSNYFRNFHTSEIELR